MSHNNDKKDTVNRIDFIRNQFLSEVKGDQHVSSSMFEKIFLPHNRVPKALIDEFQQSAESAMQMLTAQKPIFQTHIEKPYWITQEKERGFSRINVDIFGAVCLADDRHFLDVIMAHGDLIGDASLYTLRQAAEGFDLDVVWDYYANQSLIDKPLLNRGVYYRISFTDLCKAMGVKNQPKTRQGMINRLRRLSIMQLMLTPVYEGKALQENSVPMSLVDKEFHLLLDRSKIRNNMYNQSTYTDLLINISEYYASSLKNDGYISRSRMLNDYIHLVGKNNIEDFYKSLDMHKRGFVHGRFLSEMIETYFDKKMSLFGINKSFKIKQIFQQVLDDRDKLSRHFNFILHEVERPNICSKTTDYKILHLDKLKTNK